VPVHRTAVVLPETNIIVKDAAGDPVCGCTVNVYWVSQPHRKVDGRTSYQTDGDGKVHIQEQTQGEWVFPLMMHGVPFYHWAWCVEREGFDSAVGLIRWAEPGDQADVAVTLEKGTCAQLGEDYDRLWPCANHVKGEERCTEPYRVRNEK
jgi:hypothetical protein